MTFSSSLRSKVFTALVSAGISSFVVVVAYVADIAHPLFLVLQTIVVVSAILGGVAAGCASGAVFAGFIIFGHIVGFRPESFMVTHLGSFIGAVIYMGIGLGVGLVSDTAKRSRAALITEINKANKTLSESQNRFELAMKGTNDGLWDWNLKTGEIYYSPRWFGMLGQDPAEFPATLDTWAALVHPDDQARTLELVEDCISGKNTEFVTEFRMRHKDGHWVDILSRAHIEEDKGEVIRLVGTHIDMTERKRLEERNRSTARRLQQALRVARIAGWEVDAQNNLTWSDEAYRLFQFDSDKVDPDDPSALSEAFAQSVPEEDLLRVRSTFHKAREEGRHYDCVHRVILPDGQKRVFHESAEPIVDPLDGSVHMVGIVQDVTDVTELENKLQYAQKMEAIGQLTGGIAHDFNNLLAVIRGAAELIGEDPEKNFDVLQEIVSATDRGASLTRRLLVYAKQQALTPMVISISKQIEGMKSMLRRTLGETIEVTTVAPDELWLANVDPGQIEDAVINLAINARDAMADGGKLTIECSNVVVNDDSDTGNPEILPGEYVVLSVTDTGSGIPVEVQDRVFEPFFTTKEMGQGSGLGLSMIYGFAQQSGGNVTLKSDLGKGTTISVYLPRYNALLHEEEQADKKDIPQGNGETVLVIEDNEIVRLLAVRTLEGLGYHPIEAEDAFAARALLEADTEFDIILSDVVLPGGVSGPSFANEVKAKMPDAKIIFMSGFTANEAQRSELLSADSVLLRKPFKREDLARAVHAKLCEGVQTVQ